MNYKLSPPTEGLAVPNEVKDNAQIWLESAYAYAENRPQEERQKVMMSFLALQCAILHKKHEEAEKLIQELLEQIYLEKGEPK